MTKSRRAPDTPECPKTHLAATTAYDAKKCRCEVCVKHWRKLMAKYQRSWRKRHPENLRKAAIRSYYFQIKQKYNLSKRDYRNMVKAQLGACAICGKTVKENKKRLSVDHDHKTGEIRGLLCSKCNISIHSDTKLEWYLKVIKYLKL